jgi:hypothetical protein
VKIKPLKLHIDPFDWDVTYFFVTKETTLKEFTKFLDDERIGERQSSLDNFHKKTAGNAGEHYYDIAGRRSMVIIYPWTSTLKRTCTLVHENRHVVDRMCRTFCIDCIETPAYLEDWLMEKVLTHLSQ